MRKDELVAGHLYAYRPKEANDGRTFLKVKHLGPARARQCRVRYMDGEWEGLEEWVPTRQVACAWGERKALLRDEERAARLADVSASIWDPVTEEAISSVMTASGEYGGFIRRWDTDEGSADRYWARRAVRHATRK
ncbi:hypothetical protein ON058_01920 [Demequina sp. B12]|uniref:hypothetical protein n=1 Tax=Demequina sp. B12 TaxID=2992757 RepID=UPI00237B640E|nr:hypothetical protein [Demequina sp. B12]MDE0572168.1 hypothetical protein [Demequina sp. B12]